MAALTPNLVLKFEQEDELIQRKLNNVELPLRKCIRQIAQILAPAADADGDAAMGGATASDADDGETVQQAQAEQVWSVFSAQLREVELGVKKVGIVERMEDRMRAKYAAKGRQMEANKTTLQQEIVALRASLASAELTRERKLAYDVVAREVLQVGDRAALELEIAALRDERAAVGRQREGIWATVDARKGAFGRLLEDLRTLREIVPPKDEEEPAAETPEAPSAAATPLAPTPAAEETAEGTSKPSTSAAGADDEEDEDRARRTAPASKAPTPAASTPAAADVPSEDPDAELLNVEAALGDAADVDMAATGPSSTPADGDQAGVALVTDGSPLVDVPEAQRETSSLSEPEEGEAGEEVKQEGEEASAESSSKGTGKAARGRRPSSSSAVGTRRSTRSRSPIKPHQSGSAATSPALSTSDLPPSAAADGGGRPKRAAAASSTSRKSSTSEPPAKKPRTSASGGK